MKIERTWSMPALYTFSMPCVSAFLKEEMLSGVWIDPFAGKYSPAAIRNDHDESLSVERHEDGLDFLRSFGNETVAGVLFDPPYSPEQALRRYKAKVKGTMGRTEYWAKCHDEIARIIVVGGKTICFGWNSCGVGKKRGFELQRVLLICHGAGHNDTIITVEIKTQ